MDLSAGALFLSLVLSSVGFGLFVYGKKQLRTPQLAAGLALMIYPYFISDPLAMGGVGALLLGGMMLALRSGY